MLNKKVAFIGGGNMAEGIIRGMIQEGACAKENIAVYDVVERRLEYLKETYQVEIISDLKQAIGSSDILFIAVRPQDADQVLTQIKEEGGEKALIISICAGVTLDKMLGVIGEDSRIARVMPNVLIEAKHGYSGVCASPKVMKEDQTDLEIMFNALGQTMFISESQFDAFTAFSCAGPAYVMHCISGLIDAGVQCGFSRYDSRNMVLENIIGSGILLNKTGEHPFERVDKMTSPAGVTIEGVAVLNESGFTGILMDAVKAALDRTKELS